MKKYMSIKVGMVSLGCPKNQVDAEIMLADLKNAGFDIVTEPGLADVVIINTCGFIEDSKKESIENIFEFCQLKKEGQIKYIVVTGCLAERYKLEIEDEIPEADVILGIGSNHILIDAINKCFEGQKTTQFDEKENLRLTGDRIISNLPFFAYLKIADGCDNCCTYCAIPYIRGRYRSRTIEDILDEAKWLSENGVKEIILIAQDTTRYGEDIYGELLLPKLLSELCKISGIKWIRILYTYPDRITDELLDVMNKEDKIVKYLDIPLQHVSKNILKAMNRKGSFQSLTALIKNIRQKVSGIVIRTTFIVGFPGETEEDFEQLTDFVKTVKFERLGCFKYSPEEGTIAAEMCDQIDHLVKSRREEVIMNEQMLIIQEFNQKFIGKKIEVVVEGFDKYGECYFGRSENDAPDIDGKVFFDCKEKLSIGEFVNVNIIDTMDYDLFGTVI